MIQLPILFLFLAGQPMLLSASSVPRGETSQSRTLVKKQGFSCECLNSAFSPGAACASCGLASDGFCYCNDPGYGEACSNEIGRCVLFEDYCGDIIFSCYELPGDDPEETSIFTSEEVPLFTTDDSFSFTTEEDSAPTLSATLEFFTTEDALTTSARTTSRTSTTASASASATAADGSAHKREIGAALALPLLGLLAI